MCVLIVCFLFKPNPIFFFYLHPLQISSFLKSNNLKELREDQPVFVNHFDPIKQEQQKSQRLTLEPDF